MRLVRLTDSWCLRGGNVIFTTFIRQSYYSWGSCGKFLLQKKTWFVSSLIIPMTILDAFILTLFDLFNNKVNGLLDTNVDSGYFYECSFSTYCNALSLLSSQSWKWIINCLTASQHFLIIFDTYQLNIKVWCLIHVWPMFPIYTPGKHQKMFGFLLF